MDIRGWGVTRLAKELGMSHGLVSQWLKGERNPSPASLDIVADKLVADLDMLLTLAGHRPPDIELDPDSATARLMPLIEQIDWDSRPGRLEEVEAEFRFMIEVDRRQAAARKT